MVMNHHEACKECWLVCYGCLTHGLWFYSKVEMVAVVSPSNHAVSTPTERRVQTAQDVGSNIVNDFYRVSRA